MAQEADLDCDIAIVGAGLAGSLTALALAQQGWSLVLIDPRPSFDAASIRDDGRSTAVMSGGLDALRRLGIYGAIAPAAEPLWRLRIMEMQKRGLGTPEIITFDAREVGDQPFALNIPNAPLLAAAFQCFPALSGLISLPGQRVVGYTPASDAEPEHARLTLTSGQTVAARLIVAADGRNSTMRNFAKIGVREIDTDQYSFTFTIRHSRSHDNTSTEMHYPAGPLTFVPMPGQRSAVVWTHKRTDAERLKTSPEQDFTRELQRCSGGLLGQIELDSRPVAVRQQPLLAHQLTAPRLALIAEAAHALPPIGAQGLNLSLADVDTLVQLLNGCDDPGSKILLDRYAHQRRADVLARFGGTNGLNWITTHPSQFLDSLRKASLQSMKSSASLRQLAMRLGSRPVKLPSVLNF